MQVELRSLRSVVEANGYRESTYTAEAAFRAIDNGKRVLTKRPPWQRLLDQATEGVLPEDEVRAVATEVLKSLRRFRRRLDWDRHEAVLSALTAVLKMQGPILGMGTTTPVSSGGSFTPISPGCARPNESGQSQPLPSMPNWTRPTNCSDHS